MKLIVPGVKAAIASLLLCGLCGCTLLHMRDVRPVIAPPAASLLCSDIKTLRAREPQISGAIQYELPPPLPTSSSTLQIYEASPIATDFADFDSRIAARVTDGLPSELATHKVTVALRKYLAAVSAEAQLVSLASEGRIATSDGAYVEERNRIAKQEKEPNFRPSELKDFSKKLFSLQLTPGASGIIGASLDESGLTEPSKKLARANARRVKALTPYLAAYYRGNFYDRMGTAVSKPQFPKPVQTANTIIGTFSVPDAQIVAAEAVLLEYLCDLIFPVPVMGNTASPQSTTIYYPGGSTNEPTALAIHAASYLALQEDGCGITQKNVWILRALANGASDQAATVGGLVVNTPGGLSFGLGIVGKVSIGDNQTLSDLVKTAVSQIALRATLTASFYTLRHVNFPIPEPGT